MINPNTIWNHFDTLTPQFIKEKFAEDYAPILLELIVHKVCAQNKFEIMFFEFGTRKGAYIIHIYNEDKQVELRYYQNQSIELGLTLVIDGDPYFYSYKLNDDDISFLPGLLKNNMKLAVKLEVPVECNSII